MANAAVPAPVPAFDLQEESRRFSARNPLLQRHWAMRLDLAPGIAFQPETTESVEDQVLETLWAEGHTLETAGRELEAEIRASFALLTPRRETTSRTVAATLFLGFEESGRAARFEALRGLPDQLWLELSGGGFALPEVDGGAGSGGRLTAVLALRYHIPEGQAPVALVCNHAEAPGRWAAPEAWTAWD
ncbi:MAG: hypothetical protein IPL96_16435 [Holophagaceae bacterium]|nr:hypothetical protein [Holophagaceae bacterium]